MLNCVRQQQASGSFLVIRVFLIGYLAVAIVVRYLCKPSRLQYLSDRYAAIGLLVYSLTRVRSRVKNTYTQCQYNINTTPLQ